MSQFLNPTLAENFILSAGNRIFTINFERNDGVRRTINARIHVTKGVNTSPTKKPVKKSADVITIFDLKANNNEGAYRSIRKDRVLSVELAGAVLAPKAKVRKPKRPLVRTVDLTAK